MKHSLKYHLLLLAVALLYLPALAQQEADQIAIPLSDPGKPGALSVQSLNGGIKVEGYSGKEVIVRYTTNKENDRHRERKPATVDGMRRVSDNNVGLEIQEANNEVHIKVNSWTKKSDLTILVPYNFSMNLRTVNEGNIEVKDVQGELDISNVNGSVYLINVSGAAIVNTVNGVIEAQFTDKMSSAPMSFTNLNGDIKVTLPEKARFNVKAKSQFGDVYTNFDMKLKKEHLRQSSSSGGIYQVKIEDWVQGEVNGGGPELYLKSLNGGIYIQKK